MYRIFSAILAVFLFACVEKPPPNISSSRALEQAPELSEKEKKDQKIKIYDHAVKICLEASAAISNPKTTPEHDAILCQCGNKFILAHDGEGSLNDIKKENMNESGRLDAYKYITDGGTTAKTINEKCNKETEINVGKDVTPTQKR